MHRSIEHNSVVSIVAGAEKYAYVYNMDQTSIYIDMNATSTITFSGDTNVDIVQGMTENAFRALVFLCASAKDQKLLPLIVFAGMPNGPVNDEVMRHPLHRQRVVLTVQKKGYCDERVMLHWIDEANVLFHRIKTCLILLIEEIIARGFVKAGFIPTGPRTQDGAFIIPEPASE
ncbi:unnamed protein product [Phytophthora fragariaefolia]|uniref:Unnamed protein product n=1 Tax=Phytophthora fragariaefolia TaxID=1490495 RepID=A0A9W6Y0N1_9STRA|nr:unnamed protein product [Phytophthora fragariaefolia]